MSQHASEDPHHAVIIFNPMAGTRRRLFLEKTLSALEQLGTTCTVEATERVGHAELLAKQIGHSSDEKRPHLLVAAGGDGTLHEVANGLVGSDLPLGVIPLGTANVVAREIGLARSPESIARTLAHGKPTRIYLGKIGDRRFVMMAGIGFDAESVHRLKLKLKSVLGRGAYGIAAMEEFLFGNHPALTVSANGETHQAAWLVVGNGRYYAGGFSVTPNAELTDPTLEVCLYRGTRRIDIARYVISSLAGMHDRFKDVSLIRTDSLTVDGPPEAFVQADGDIIGHLPVTLSSDGGTIELIYPPSD